MATSVATFAKVTVLEVKVEVHSGLQRNVPVENSAGRISIQYKTASIS
jgi:hypothetical protein